MQAAQPAIPTRREGDPQGHAGTTNSKAGDFRPIGYSPRATRRLLFPLDFHHLIGLGATGGDNLDLSALFLADQRPGQRRSD